MKQKILLLLVVVVSIWNTPIFAEKVASPSEGKEQTGVPSGAKNLSNVRAFAAVKFLASESGHPSGIPANVRAIYSQEKCNARLAEMADIPGSTREDENRTETYTEFRRGSNSMLAKVVATSSTEVSNIAPEDYDVKRVETIMTILDSPVAHDLIARGSILTDELKEMVQCTTNSVPGATPDLYPYNKVRTFIRCKLNFCVEAN